MHRGFTLVEVLIGLAIFSIVIGAVYSGYTSVIDIASSSQFTSASLSIMESRVEMVRNMRYEDVGTVGGVPAGTLPQTETVQIGDVAYNLITTIRNVDDPFDGTIFGSPADLSPADYKLVQFDVTCGTGCAGQKKVSMTTIVAEKRLENEDRNGNLLITVIDASGEPVPQATLHVVNAGATPPIDLTTTTDNAGQLLLLSVATGSAAYEITATMDGYSTDATTPPNNPANALKPHATVASQQLTQVTMIIDRVSTLSVTARDSFCAATGPFSFQLTGGKLIGELPDVPKYSAIHSLSTGGTLTLDELEWDSYEILPVDTSLDLVGMTSSISFTLDPNTTRTLTWMVASKSSSAALITVVDTGGSPIDGASVTLTGSGSPQIRRSGYWPVGDTDWSAGQYTDISSALDASVPGVVTLELQGGIYATGSAETLTSRTFDLGTSDAVIRRLDWGPVSQPADTTVRFQLAANNDNATWDYVGPDGASTSYFESPGAVDVAALTGKRYVRYRLLLETLDGTVTPAIEDVSLEFSSSCVLSGHAYFGGLTNLTQYTAAISAPGFQNASTSFTVDDAWQHLYIELSP